MILEKITVRCKRGFRTYRGGKVTADVEKDEIYEAKLYKPTEEYFAKDSKGREFLVGEISFDERNVILEEEFEFLGTIGIDLAKGKDKTVLIGRGEGMRTLIKSVSESFFIRLNLGSKIAYEVFREEAKFKGKEVVVLQVMHCANDVVIVELIHKEDYAGKKYYHNGELIEENKDESIM